MTNEFNTIRYPEHGLMLFEGPWFTVLRYG